LARVNNTLRNIDHFVGPILLAFLSIFKFRTKIPPVDIKRLAIVRTAAIGDTILLSGIILDFKSKFPNSEIIFIVGQSNSSIVNFISGVDKVYTLKSLNPLKIFLPLRSLGQFDVAINFGQWPNIDALITWMLQSRFTIGFNTPFKHHHYIYDLKINHSNQIHEIDNFRNLIKPLGVNSKSLPQLNISSIKPNPLLEFKESYIVMIPWSAGRRKNLKEWPLNNWISLIKGIRKSDRRKILILGVKEDYENAKGVMASFEDGNDILNLVGKSTLNDFVLLISSASLVISVNTGGLHIASALNIPLVALDGIVPSRRWGPLSQNSISLQCKPEHQFINLGFETKIGAESYMEEILPEDVIIAIEKLKNLPPSRHE